MLRTFPFFTACSLFLFASCGTVDVVKETAANAGNTVRTFSISHLRPSSIDVVDVREDDLEEMTLGKEKALAFERKRSRSLWSFNLPNFREPELPAPSEDSFEHSLLPPKPL
ncbi:MAG: hypothetical protein AB8D78_09550 [Akkermansiaceae bacterium]